MRRVFLAALMGGLLCAPAVAQDHPGGAGGTRPVSSPLDEAFPDNGSEMANKVMQALKANPDLVLDALRANPEAVLEIAQEGSAIKKRKALHAQWERELSRPADLRLGERPARGSADAPIKIAVFSDFTCHYCARLVQTMGELLAGHGEEIVVIQKHGGRDKGPGREIAAWHLAAHRQDPQKAWAFHDSVFANQQALFRMLSAGKPMEPFLAGLASELGLDAKKIRKDVKGKDIQRILDEDAADFRKFGEAGTPFTVISGMTIPGAQGRQVFEAAIARALSHQKDSRKGN